MKNILALIGAAVVILGGLGWYLGWYRLATEPAADGHRKIQIDVDTAKIRGDVQKGKEKIKDALAKDGKPAATEVRPTVAQPTGLSGSSLKFNEDGSVTYQGSKGGGFTLPPLVPGQK